MALGKQVQRYREALEITVPQLSEITGIDTVTLYAMESRDSKRSNFMKKLATALFLTIDELSDAENDYLPLAIQRRDAAAASRDKAHGRSPKEGEKSAPIEPTPAPAGGYSPLPKIYEVQVSGMVRLATDDEISELGAPVAEPIVRAYISGPSEGVYGLTLLGSGPGFLDHGHTLIVSPRQAAPPRSMVIVTHRDGRRYLRKLLVDSGDALTFESASTGKAMTLPRTDIESVHRVLNIVMG